MTANNAYFPGLIQALQQKVAGLNNSFITMGSQKMKGSPQNVLNYQIIAHNYPFIQHVFSFLRVGNILN